MARCNEGLLICECDGLFCLYGGNCRTDAKHTDNCGYNYVTWLNGGTFNETVHAITYFDISIRKACAKLFGIVFITYTDKLWLKFPCLFLYRTSRKSVIGLTLDLPVEEREEGTMVTTVYGVQKGCAFVRVHDVEKNKRAIRMTIALMREHEV